MSCVTKLPRLKSKDLTPNIVRLKIFGVGHTLKGHQNVVEVDAVPSLLEIQIPELAAHLSHDIRVFREVFLNIFHVNGGALPSITDILDHLDLVSLWIFILSQSTFAPEIFVEALCIYHSVFKNRRGFFIDEILA